MKHLITNFNMLKIFLLLAGFTFFGTTKSAAQCNANFNFFVDTTNGNVTFANTSTFITPTRTFLWYFGSHGTSTQVNPVKNLPPGTHMVCLYVFDSTCSDSTCKIIVVPPSASGNCNANFSHSVNNSTGNVSFLNSSTGTGLGSYLWTFSGGNGSSTQSNPSKIFAPGTYQVCLTATFSNGSCADTICKSITVGPRPCDANFTYVIDTATGNVQFTNSSTSSGTPSYTWYFGSSGTSTQTNPLKNLAPGTHQICLFLNDSFCFDSTCKTVVIPQPPCNANFTYSVDSITGDIRFHNSSTGTGTGSYFWTFGGSGTSTATNPVKSLAPGSYNVCLFATFGSCTDTICKTVVVAAQPCDAGFTFFVDSTNTVHFTNTSTGTGTPTYFWNFGSHGTSTLANPFKSLPPGNHLVCLFVTFGSCTDSICKTVTIPAFPCNADFTFTVDSLNNVHFNNTSSGTGAPAYTWNFGGLGSSTLANPSFTLPAGIHLVCLRAQFGTCIDSVCRVVKIDTVTCNASFTYSIFPDTASSTRRIVVFNNTSTGNNLVYFWTFGVDSSVSGAQSPIHHYPVNGTYTACLVVRSLIDSCMDSTCITFTIAPDSTTSISDPDLLSGIKIYPVPFNDMIHIDMHANKAGMMDIAVYDMVGRLRMEKTTLVEFGSNKLEMNLAELSHGFYTIELKIDNQRKTQRVVK